MINEVEMMKKIWNKMWNWIKDFCIDFKKNPKKKFYQLKNRMQVYIHNNVLFITYVMTTVINATLLRFFTMNTLENYLSMKPIIADIAVVTLVGAFGYLLKPKKRFAYFMFFEIFFTAICMINSIYYTFYTSFASISMLSLTQFIAPVGDAVVENVLQIKDLIYLWGPIVFVIVHLKLKKKGYYNRSQQFSVRKKKTFKTLILGSFFLVVFTLSLNSLEVGRFVKQWNREYIVMKFGIFTYQANDVVQSVGPKITSLFGLDQAMKSFHEYFEVNKQEIPKTNEYTNLFEGKNIIAIHAESMQTFAMGLTFNGQEVTPTLNRLAKEGFFFDNFYSQVSVGTSSDTELTLSTSLMPTHSGTAFVSYFDREYISIPKLLKEKGYYTFSMHANTADFWNRRIMHENLGYDRFYSKKDFEVTSETSIGLGLADKEFFKQTIPKLIEIKDKDQPFYGTFIMLTNHTPFSEVDKYGEFDVDMKEQVTNENGEVVTISHPYMEGTKLGNYLKSIHYADAALGQFLEDLNINGLLDNTVFVLYGDHDARLPKSDFLRLYNYDKTTDSILPREDPNYVEFDSYQYELNRKVPFMIWTKEKQYHKTIHNVMGMYDVMPTLGNLFGFYNPYQLGHDIFNVTEDNIVVFPNGNWVTNKVYYNSQKQEYLPLKGDVISEEYIKNCNEYADALLDVSNDMIVFDLIRKEKETEDLLEEAKKGM